VRAQAERALAESLGVIARKRARRLAFTLIEQGDDLDHVLGETPRKLFGF